MQTERYRLARDLARGFDRVYWRSMRNAPLLTEWAAGAIDFVSDHQRLPPDNEAAQVELLLELLRERRCLLILDNLEVLLRAGDSDGEYLESYAGYGRLLQSVGEIDHQSCLLLTSREAPPELDQLSDAPRAVQVVELGGLNAYDGQALLSDKRLVGDAVAWTGLVKRYGGNGVRRLLDSRVERLSEPEHRVLLDECFLMPISPTVPAILTASNVQGVSFFRHEGIDLRTAWLA